MNNNNKTNRIILSTLVYGLLLMTAANIYAPAPAPAYEAIYVITPEEREQKQRMHEQAEEAKEAQQKLVEQARARALQLAVEQAQAEEEQTRQELILEELEAIQALAMERQETPLIVRKKNVKDMWSEQADIYAEEFKMRKKIKALDKTNKREILRITIMREINEKRYNNAGKLIDEVFLTHENEYMTISILKEIISSDAARIIETMNTNRIERILRSMRSWPDTKQLLSICAEFGSEKAVHIMNNMEDQNVVVAFALDLIGNWDWDWIPYDQYCAFLSATLNPLSTINATKTLNILNLMEEENSVFLCGQSGANLRQLHNRLHERLKSEQA